MVKPPQVTVSATFYSVHLSFHTILTACNKHALTGATISDYIGRGDAADMEALLSAGTGTVWPAPWPSSSTTPRERWATRTTTADRRLLDAAFSLEFLARHEHVLLVGPAGVGKSFLSQALGYAAVRSGHTVCFIHADDHFKVMNQTRVDNSLECTFRSFLSPDLLILDGLILNRHRASSFMITSNLITPGRPPGRVRQGCSRSADVRGHLRTPPLRTMPQGYPVAPGIGEGTAGITGIRVYAMPAGGPASSAVNPRTEMPSCGRSDSPTPPGHREWRPGCPALPERNVGPAGSRVEGQRGESLRSPLQPGQVEGLECWRSTQEANAPRRATKRLVSPPREQGMSTGLGPRRT